LRRWSLAGHGVGRKGDQTHYNHSGLK